MRFPRFDSSAAGAPCFSRRASRSLGLGATAWSLLACLPSLAFAQTTYFWNGANPSASPAAGGAGTWDGTTANWRQDTTTGTAVSWPAAGSATDRASFDGTAGTVTLSGTRTANQLGLSVTGYTLTGGTLALDGTAPAISVSTGTATVASPVSGSTGLVKTGAGTLVLSGTNTFTGDTTISAGTLQLNAQAAAANGLITLGDAATGASTVQLTLGTNIDRSGFTSDITVANQGTGTATIKWIESVTNGASGAGTITLNRATTFDGTQFAGGVYFFNHSLSGAGELTVTGTNATRLLLQAASAGFTGNITIQSGGIFEPRNTLTATTGNTVTVNSGGELRVQFAETTIGGLNGGGSVRDTVRDGILTVGKGNAGGSFSGTISGTTTNPMRIKKVGTGTQILSGTNTYQGGTTIVAGTLQIGSTSGAGTGTITLGTVDTGANSVQLTLGTNADRVGFSNAITVANQGTGTATIKWIETTTTATTGNGLITLDRATTFDATQFAGGFVSFNHALAGAGALTLTSTNNTRLIMEVDAPNFSGDVTVQNGGIFEPRNRLTATSGNTLTLDSGARVNVNGGLSVGGLNGAGLVSVATASGTLTIGKGDASGSFSGAINPGVSLVKTGAGTQVLSGASTYSGTTTISGGTLEVTNNAALGTSSVSLAAGATLRVAPGTTIANTFSLAGGGIERVSPLALGTVADIVAGTAATPVALAPVVAWSPRVAGTTYSDVLGLTNTAGTIQILEVTYDPSLLGSIAETDAFLGWDDNGAWVNAIAGNTGAAGGSAVFNQTGSFASLGVLPTAAYLGSWGRDTATNTAWAVVDHNSDFAVIAVPEPGLAALAGGAAAALGIARVRRRFRPEAR